MVADVLINFYVQNALFVQQGQYTHAFVFYYFIAGRPFNFFFMADMIFFIFFYQSNNYHYGQWL